MISSTIASASIVTVVSESERLGSEAWEFLKNSQYIAQCTQTEALIKYFITEMLLFNIYK